MGSHPVNLAIRFLLEIVALLVMGIWGWGQSEDWWRFILAFGVPILAATIWGVFAVPDDPSRSGAAPIPVPGSLRLMIELSIFIFSVWALFDLSYNKLGMVLGLIILIHYVFSYDRVIWLFTKNDDEEKKQI